MGVVASTERAFFAAVVLIAGVVFLLVAFTSVIDALGVREGRHRPALRVCPVARVNELLIRVLRTAVLVRLAVVFVSVAALPRIVFFYMSTVITAVNKALELGPVATTRQLSGVASPPVIPDPPPVGVVRIRAVAVAVVVALVPVRRAAKSEVGVVLRIPPAGLRRDPTEPALAAAVDGAIEEGRLLALGCAGRSERLRAVSERLRRRAVEVRAIAEVSLVVGPGRPGVVAAVLRWGLWMLQSSPHEAANAQNRSHRLRDTQPHCSRRLYTLWRIRIVLLLGIKSLFSPQKFSGKVPAPTS